MIPSKSYVTQKSNTSSGPIQYPFQEAKQESEEIGQGRQNSRGRKNVGRRGKMRGKGREATQKGKGMGKTRRNRRRGVA